MDTLYPANPSPVPQDLTKPGSIYKRRAWLAMGGLFLFLLIYAGFTYWFGHTAYKVFSGLSAGADIGFSGILSGIIASVLFIFMVKALFAVKHNGQVQDMEVTADQQPELFQFLNKLADDAGAPRPHKVYLSAQVNAAVFYDLSLLNLFFPSKKNLLIGLGLVNILNLGELKAVLAHEFGHFAQRSMAVGRWVYIAQQIASHIVGKRDWLDSFLQGLSRIDLRIAWVGWILRLIVWSVRALLDTLFGLVVLSERALSRQMEFQADLVAVSLTGSDALVHALSKLSAGDDAWNRTLNFVNKELNEGRKVKDIFAIQTQMLEKLRSIYQNENYGKVSEVPADNPQSHRVFKSKIALPPQMWSTHPENTAREENAKRVYIPCAIDNRSAWEIFRQADQIKIDMSQHLLKGVTKEAEEVELHESLNYLDKFYQKVWLSSEYRGSYLGRSVVRHAASVKELYDELPSIKPDDFEELYPESLTHQLEDLRDLQEEKAMLEALRDRMLKASGGIQFRGKLITKKELPVCIKQVIDEINKIETEVIAHHKKIRSIHLAAASALGSGWKDYSLGLLSVLHYVDHAEADFNDATALVANVWTIITADGKVSNSERQRLVDAVSSVHKIMETLYQQSSVLQLDTALIEKWGYKAIADVVGIYEVAAPTTKNIGEWMKIFDGWTGVFRFALSELKYAALELLLLTEKQMAQAYRSNETPAPAPEPSRVPDNYNLLLPGKERKKQKKLDLWDSFITASGLVPAIARFTVAGIIIGSVFWLGQSVGSVSVAIYNGLAQPIKVNIAGSVVNLSAYQSKTLSVPPGDSLEVVTTTSDGLEIERFIQKISSGHNIYNVAQASPLIKWWASYGNSADQKPQHFGATRWLDTSADYYFVEPPSSIKVSKKDDSGRRSVISGFGDLSPSRTLGMLKNDAEQEAVILAHAKWDNANSLNFLYWLNLLARHENALDVVRERLKRQPETTALMRMEQDLTQGEEHDQVCAQHQSAAKAAPENADLSYLAIRCLPDGEEQDQAFLAGRQQWSNNPWFAMAAGHIAAQKGDWVNAASDYGTAAKKYAPLTLYISDSLARIQRVLSQENIKMSTLVKANEQLEYVLDLEVGSEFEGLPEYAYHLLNQGKLDQAIKVAKSDEFTYSKILPLVASSPGANPARVKQAFNEVNEKNLDESTAWTMLALASRENQPLDSYQNYLSALQLPYQENLIQFLSAIKTSTDFQSAEQLLKNLQPQQRGYAYSMAVILLQEKCPKSWRDMANKLLFVNEKPYMAMN